MSCHSRGQLKHEAQERAHQERAQRKEVQRVNQWIADSSDETLVKGYLKILMKVWSGDSSFSTGYKAGHHQSVVLALRERQILTEAISKIESPYGVLRRLALAYKGAWGENGVVAMHSLASAAQGGEDSAYAVDIMVALASRRGEMNASQLQTYGACCAVVTQEVLAENPRFQRDARRQRLHELVVPALAEIDQGDFGSSSHYARMKHARLESARTAAVRVQRRERVRTGRVLEAKADGEREIALAIEETSRTICWRSFMFGALDSAALIARYSHNRPADLRFVNLSGQDVISTAERYRNSSATIASALTAMNFTVPADVPMAARALVHAGLCVSVESQPRLPASKE